MLSNINLPPHPTTLCVFFNLTRMSFSTSWSYLHNNTYFNLSDYLFYLRAIEIRSSASISDPKTIEHQWQVPSIPKNKKCSITSKTLIPADFLICAESGVEQSWIGPVLCQLLHHFINIYTSNKFFCADINKWCRNKKSGVEQFWGIPENKKCSITSLTLILQISAEKQ